jgi:hypothetical protein
MGLMAGLAGTGNLAPTGIRSPDRPIRSESLYCLFPGVKRPGREIDHLHLVPKLRISEAVPLLLYAFMA